MGDITALLKELRGGNRSVEEQLLDAVYAHLKRLAARQLRAERPGHTLDPTALVHETYLRLVDEEIPWNDRAHFYAVAAQAMRRILVDYARSRIAERRGGRRERINLDDVILFTPERPDEFLILNEALERLDGLDRRQAAIVEMRFFGGLTEEEIAGVLHVSIRTVRREWRMAKAWLHGELRDLVVASESP